MDINRFGEFAILAQAKTFLEASELLFMSQSTLSKHIMALERELGVTLVDRSSRHVALTERGMALLPYAQKFAALQHQLKSALADRHSNPLETISVGSIPIMAPYGIIDAVVDFQQANPSYSVQLVEGEGNDLKRRLLREELDLAFIRDADETTPELKRIPFTTDQLVAVLPADHPLSAQERIAFTDPIDENFLLLPHGSFVTELVQQKCSEAGFAPRITFTGKRAENIISLVARGAGVALLMRQPTQALAGSDVRLLPVAPETTSSISVYLKRNRSHSQAVISFIGYLPYRQLLKMARDS